MFLFLSSETGDIDGEKLRMICNQIDSDLSFITDRKNENILEKDQKYGTEFESIAIITMILSPRFDIYKERRLIRFKEHWADIRLKINYDHYQKSNDSVKRLLLIKNIVDSIMVVENRKKGDFQGIKLIDDILQALKVKKEDLDNL